MELMRKTVDATLRKYSSRTVNSGLWLSRGWSEFVKQDGAGSKSAHLDKICKHQPSDLYQLAYRRWQALTSDSQRFRTFYGKLEHRMFIGLSSASALETGVTTSHTYGMPMIPGSSIKGVVRSHAATLGVPASYLNALFGEGADGNTEPTERLPGAGSLVWHDAWWIPDSQSSPFVQEIVTVHHQEYYSGKGDATDFDSPIPNAQLAVQGSFLFCIEGDPAWTELAYSLLKKALAEKGIGSKVAAGYGFMVEDSLLSQKANAEAKKQRQQTMSPADQVRDILQGMNEKQLGEAFGKNINKTLEGFTEEQQALIPTIAQEVCQAILEGWAGVSKKDDKNKYKAYRFLMGRKEDNA